MAEIAKFDARAPRKGSVPVDERTGAPEALASIAQASGQLAARLGQMADKAARREGIEDAQRLTPQVSMPGVEFAYDQASAATSPAKPFKTSDPAAKDLPPHARALLNAIAGGESGGSYNVRYTPNGPSHFSDMSKHPGIFVPGPHGRTSASGRYQFTLTTWNSVGGGDFSPENQDRQAWRLAQRDYRANTGRNLDADLRAGGLTPGIVNALSPTWAAFKHGQARHLATYQASLARFGNEAPVNVGSTIDFARAGAVDPVVTAAAPGGDAPSSAPAPADTGIKVTLTGAAGPVPQVQPGTIYGDAFNAAAIDIHVNRLDTAMRQQMDAIALQHDGDPAALIPALDALRAGFVADLPPQAATLIDQSFQREKFALVRGATTQWRNNLESADIAAAEENIAARTTNAFRLAAKAGVDAAADAAIAGELGALEAQIDGTRLTPLQKSRLKADAASGVISARVLGGFEAMKDPAARAEYAKTFQDDWIAGEGLAGKLDAKTYDTINGELIRRTQADAVAAQKRATALGKSIDDQVDFLKKGWPIPEGQRSLLKSEVAKTGDAALAKNLDFLDSLSAWQKAHVASRPEVVDAQIAALEAKIQKDGITEAAATTLDVMEGLRDQMAKGLATDPLTWANRAGVAQVEPLNFSDGATLAASLTERVADARAVAAHYGIAPKFFTPAETDAMKKTLRDNPLGMPSLVSSLSAGLGRDTPRALAEISDDAPLLAHVGGLVHMTGDQRVAVEVAEALERRAQPGYKSALPSAAKQQSAFAAYAGAAFSVLPGAAAGAAETAAALFETRALARGVDMEQFDQPGSPARALYEQALDEALGATYRDGQKFGGVADVNGRETIAPPDVAADSLEDMLSEISADDLLFQPAIGSANGVPIRIEDLRGGQLVMVATGRYRIALGDIEGGNPLYVASPTNGYFELDIGMLKRSQQGRGASSAATPLERRRSFLQRYGDQFDR